MTYREQRKRPMTAPEMAFEFVRTRFLSIIAVLLLGGGLGVLIGYDLGIPRWARLGAVTAIVLSPWGVIVGSWLIDLFPEPPGVVLVDVDARRMDGAVFWLPEEWFLDLEVTEGELNQVAPSLYFGKEVDLDELTAEGTWRGTMSDRELIRGLQKVFECRGQLEDDAKKGFIIETQAFTIVRSAVRDATRSVVETFARGSLPDEGDGIDNAIEEAISKWDLEDRLRDELDDVDDLDADLSDKLLDPDGDLEQQAEQQVNQRVDSTESLEQARAEATDDD